MSDRRNKISDGRRAGPEMFRLRQNISRPGRHTRDAGIRGGKPGPESGKMNIGAGLEKTDSFAEKTSFILSVIFLFSINFSIALCYIIFTLLLISSAVIFYREGRKPALPPYFKYLIFFALLTLVSTVFSVDPAASIEDNKELFVYLLIPVFILVLKRTEMYCTAIYTVLYSAVISSIIGIIISAMHGISLEHRLKGFSSHWMTYSGLLMIVFVFFFVFNMYEKRKKVKTLNFILLIPVLTAILLSMTRSVWIGIFVSIGTFILFHLRKKPGVLIGSGIVFLIALLLLPGSIKSRMFSIFDVNNVTNRDRLHMAYTAFEIVKANPLTGVGSDNVKKVYADFRHRNAIKDNPHLHNNFFQIAAERGIPSLILFIAFFTAIITGLAGKIRNGTERERRVSTAVLFLVTAFLTAGMFEYNFGDTEIRFLLLFFISLPYLNIFNTR